MTRLPSFLGWLSLRFEQGQAVPGTSRSGRPEVRVEELEQRNLLANAVSLVPGLSGQTVGVHFDWMSKDAEYRNELGLFRVDDVRDVSALCDREIAGMGLLWPARTGMRALPPR
jgi:hypothetical protein